MILYHVSFDFDRFRKLFIPRIPKNKAGHEDSKIPRVCFSDNIDNCLSALSDVEDSICESHYINVYRYSFSREDKNLISYKDFMIKDLFQMLYLLMNTGIAKQSIFRQKNLKF